MTKRHLTGSLTWFNPIHPCSCRNSFIEYPYHREHINNLSTVHISFSIIMFITGKNQGTLWKSSPNPKSLATFSQAKVEF